MHVTLGIGRGGYIGQGLDRAAEQWVYHSPVAIPVPTVDFA